MTTFSGMAADARVWIYAANRILTQGEQDEILSKARAFTSGWTAHEQPLNAAVDILHDCFVVFMVDENFNEVSGCGIDKSVAFMKSLGQETGIDFFNRMQVELLTPKGLILTSKAGAKKLLEEEVIQDTTITFNKTLTHRSELDSRFMIPFSQSWSYPGRPVNA
jgi:hypothetical protein